ncbi:hypothetical protein [Humisphaera borealis]|uniref:Uncharacterized protein n=1 Tax=Humisphaera borealis TaxID=2807512 RepID=A0A7M2WQD7_9BACT|nr:hypothetical protein [Humisphaera borealis]QOV87464.1 hypothetical protein IPV69_14320 [Humisphaera borealis]
MTRLSYPNTFPRVPEPVKSTASIIAIACAVGSFFVDHAMLRLLLVCIAVVAGLIGLLRSVSPRVSGGILSVVAIVLAAIGFVVALFDVVF